MYPELHIYVRLSQTFQKASVLITHVNFSTKKPLTKKEDVIDFYNKIHSTKTDFKKTIDKVKELKKFIDEDKLHTIIQIDGGINSENSKKLFELGTTLNVVGSFLIKNISKDTLSKLKKK